MISPLFPAFVGGTFIRLTGAAWRPIHLGASGSGDLDLYTCPAGKRALIGARTLYNANAGTATVRNQIKIGATYFRISSDISIITATASTSIGDTGYILNAGEIFGVNTNVNLLNLWYRVLEFDDSVALFSALLTTVAAADNTLYTVPTGKSAVILDGNSQPAGVGTVPIINSSGGNLTMTGYSTPSGGTKRQVTAGVSALNVTRASMSVPGALAAGDALIINSSGIGTANQAIWANVIEVPQ